MEQRAGKGVAHLARARDPGDHHALVRLRPYEKAVRFLSHRIQMWPPMASEELAWIGKHEVRCAQLGYVLARVDAHQNLACVSVRLVDLVALREVFQNRGLAQLEQGRHIWCGRTGAHGLTEWFWSSRGPFDGACVALHTGCPQAFTALRGGRESVSVFPERSTILRVLHGFQNSTHA